MYIRKHKLHFIFGITASTAAYYVSIMPHTIFLDKLQEFFTLYRNARKIQLNNKFKVMCQEVMNDLKLPKEEQSLIKPFHVIGFEPFHAGTLNNKSGGIIGIPMNFKFTDLIDIPSEDILIGLKPLNVLLKEADLLLDSFILSENAQKYAVAHEILRIKNKEVYKSAYGLSFSILFATLFYNRVVHKYNFYQKDKCYRYTLLTFSILIALMLWLAYKDNVSCQLDNSIDESISKLGLNYIEGGKEFYEKLLQRHCAERSLLGDQGKKVFNANGNEEYFLRQRSLPLTHRKEFFEKKFKNIHTMA